MYRLDFVEHFNGSFSGPEQVVKSYIDSQGLVDFSVDGERFVEDDYFVKESRQANFTLIPDDYLKDLLLEYDSSKEIAFNIDSTIEGIEDTIINTRISKLVVRFYKDDELLYTGNIDYSKTVYDYFTFKIKCFDPMVLISKLAETLTFDNRKHILSVIPDIVNYANQYSGFVIPFENNIFSEVYSGQPGALSELRYIKNLFRDSFLDYAENYQNGTISDYEFAFSFPEFLPADTHSQIRVTAFATLTETYTQHDVEIIHKYKISRMSICDIESNQYQWTDTNVVLGYTAPPGNIFPDEYQSITAFLQSLGDSGIQRPYWTISQGEYVPHIDTGYSFIGSQIFDDNGQVYLKTFGFADNVFFLRNYLINIEWNAPATLKVSAGTTFKKVISAVLLIADLQFYVTNSGELIVEKISFDTTRNIEKKNQYIKLKSGETEANIYVKTLNKHNDFSYYLWVHEDIEDGTLSFADGEDLIFETSDTFLEQYTAYHIKTVYTESEGTLPLTQKTWAKNTFAAYVTTEDGILRLVKPDGETLTADGYPSNPITINLSDSFKNYLFLNLTGGMHITGLKVSGETISSDLSNWGGDIDKCENIYVYAGSQTKDAYGVPYLDETNRNRNFIPVSMDALVTFAIKGLPYQQKVESLETLDIFELTESNTNKFAEFQKQIIGYYKTMFSEKLPIGFECSLWLDDFKNIDISKGRLLFIDDKYYFINKVDKDEYLLKLEGWMIR